MRSYLSSIASLILIGRGPLTSKKKAVSLKVELKVSREEVARLSPQLMIARDIYDQG